jgi:hypothetical protein
MDFKAIVKKEGHSIIIFIILLLFYFSLYYFYYEVEISNARYYSLAEEIMKTDDEKSIKNIYVLLEIMKEKRLTNKDYNDAIGKLNSSKCEAPSGH